jgi:hypothetical protein
LNSRHIILFNLLRIKSIEHFFRQKILDFLKAPDQAQGPPQLLDKKKLE